MFELSYQLWYHSRFICQMFHRWLHYLLQQLHAQERDIESAGNLMMLGADYANTIKAEYTRILFLLSRGMVSVGVSVSDKHGEWTSKLLCSSSCICPKVDKGWLTDKTWMLKQNLICILQLQLMHMCYTSWYCCVFFVFATFSCYW